MMHSAAAAAANEHNPQHVVDTSPPSGTRADPSPRHSEDSTATFSLGPKRIKKVKVASHHTGDQPATTTTTTTTARHQHNGGGGSSSGLRPIQIRKQWTDDDFETLKTEVRRLVIDRGYQGSELRLSAKEWAHIATAIHGRTSSERTADQCRVKITKKFKMARMDPANNEVEFIPRKSLPFAAADEMMPSSISATAAGGGGGDTDHHHHHHHHRHSNSNSNNDQSSTGTAPSPAKRARNNKWTATKESSRQMRPSRIVKRVLLDDEDDGNNATTTTSSTTSRSDVMATENSKRRGISIGTV